MNFKTEPNDYDLLPKPECISIRSENYGYYHDHYEPELADKLDRFKYSKYIAKERSLTLNTENGDTFSVNVPKLHRPLVVGGPLRVQHRFSYSSRAYLLFFYTCYFFIGGRR